MPLIDLSVPVNEDTPAYPGDPHIQIKQLATFDEETYNDHAVAFGIHSSGTHIDGPWHMVREGKKLDEIPLERFVGRGRLIKVENGNYSLDAVKAADIQEGDIVLFDTGMAKVYGQDEYYADGRPEMPEDVARYLVDKKVKMIGLDMCSPDQAPFPVHRILLGADILIIENMASLEALKGREFTVYALPLKLQLDGAPARVIAEVDHY